VQAFHVLVSIRRISRYVHAVRTSVTWLLAVAGAHHMPFQVRLLCVIVGTVQTLIRSYVPRTVRIPGISWNIQTTAPCPICKYENIKSSVVLIMYKLQKNFDTKKFCITDTLIFFIKKDAHKLIEICQNYVMMKGENFNVSRNIALIHAIFFNISYRTIFFNIPYEN